MPVVTKKKDMSLQELQLPVSLLTDLYANCLVEPARW